MGEHAVVLNSKNFDKETSKGEWVIDFWAEWCVSPNTNIYTSNLNSKPAKKVNVGDNLISYNNNLNNDRVVRSLTTNKGGHCKKITSKSGRIIETTDDHAFFTERGWVTAQNLNEEDKVAIMPVRDPILFVGINENLISEKDFEYFENEYKNIKKYMLELKEKSLLPLEKNNEKILVLARLIGALFSDGSLYRSKENNYREISFTVGQNTDVDDIIKDLSVLGFETIHVSERTNENEINNRKFITHTFKVKCLSTSLYLLFLLLGVPEGNKTNNKYCIPYWIKNGELAIQREFLSGYLGGDGPRVSMRVLPRNGKNSYNSVNINDIEFRKEESLLDSGLKFAEDVSDMLKNFGIKTGEIFYELDTYLRKNNSRTNIIHIPIMSNFMNGFIMSQIVGYSYCRQKQFISMYAGEFIRELLKKRESWKRVYDNSIELFKKGLDYSKISEILKLDKITVYNWVVKGVKPSIAKHNIKFDDWLNNSKKNLREGLIWSKIEKIEETNLPEVQVITTEKDHNFIANGFLVHNCGPCKISEPHFEAAAQALKGKVKFGKVNIDNEQELAERFEVMSIPSFVFIKNGEMVDKIVGAVSKDSIVDRVSEAF